jgi:hypothetical protein
MNNEISSLKEYYIKIQAMHRDAVDMLTAINQSLSSAAPEVTVTVTGDDGGQTRLRIPSFLYLENRLEQLDGNMESLFSIPKSGEAWFSRSSDMFKLQMVKSSSAPVTPELGDGAGTYAGTKRNNVLKDLVSPKTFMRLDISNLPDNIDAMYVRKYVLYSKSVYDALAAAGVKTYEQYEAALYTMKKGVDWDAYDMTVGLPVRKDRFSSSFAVEAVGTSYTGASGKPCYDVTFDTLSYADADDQAITFQLKAGDYVTLKDGYCVYLVKSVNSSSMSGSVTYTAILEEHIGHVALQPVSENQNMVMEIYNEDYSAYHYVDVPLEEDRYVAILTCTVCNNIRSGFSDAVLVDLNSVYMHGEDGSVMYEDGSPVTYMRYYEKYCHNIGDLIEGLTETAYPQVSNFTPAQLDDMANGTSIQGAVTDTVTSVMDVVKINSHLVDDKTSENILSLHEQKSELTTQLNTVQANIDQIYNQLTSTDFAQQVTVTQNTLKSQLDSYYEERLKLQKQVIAVVDNINLLKGTVEGYDKSKFRIRGQALSDTLDSYLHTTYSSKCDAVGLDVQYKYKSVTKDTTQLSNVSSGVFTDWNRTQLSDRARELTYDADAGTYTVGYADYSSNSNVIKWNQIDIPIRQGEDVVVRVRYKLNVGQPFIDIYTPWSDETTVTFPTELAETTELSDVIAANEDDTVSAKFTSALLSGGYQEHISDKIIDNSTTFFHMPEHIYSGFNTAENKLISLKDKLNQVDTDLNSYKTLMESELNAEFSVYLEWEGNVVSLTDTAHNTVTVNDSLNSVKDSFTRKDMNIIIRNTGSRDINLYSIFPGSSSVFLLNDSQEAYASRIRDYERVPLLIGDSPVPEDSVSCQTLGQWIYFRQTDPYTGADAYYRTDATDAKDTASAMTGTGTTAFSSDASAYIAVNGMQAPLAYRNRLGRTDGVIGKLTLDTDGKPAVSTPSEVSYAGKGMEFFKYNWTDWTTKTAKMLKDSDQNTYILEYEHIMSIGTDTSTGSLAIKRLTANDSISSFITNGKANPLALGNMFNNQDNYCGAFLIPSLKARTQVLCNTDKNGQYLKLGTGKSVSVPVTFEYYLNSSKKDVSKTIYFDLRPSLASDPRHYSLTVKASYNYIQIASSADATASVADLVRDDG